jgi:hypothetical protein
MKKTKSIKSTKKQVSEEKPKDKKTPMPKFGVLGKDLSNQFSSRGDRAWRPTKPGGRNGQGKPS